MEIPERTAVPDDIVDPSEAANDHARSDLYGTPRRRALLSAFILATLVSVIGLATPDSALKAGLLTVARPFVGRVGASSS